ncbi:ladderlectin-like [Engraulis encrasicolus]|uniref:ladderlectin-like n=1 Tax=Engraulis encrasicolus TaxID=184585 RepID=UPI002FCE7450
MTTLILLLSLGFLCSATELIHSENITKDSSFSEVSSRASCPGGWRRFSGRCYRFTSTARTWAEAERYCLLLGGNLASVHSVAEYHYIQGLIVTHTHGSPFTWLGGTDAQQNGIWFWSDGSRFTFHLWSPGEPNNQNNRNEACLHMNLGG